MLVNTNFTIHFGMYYDNYIEKMVFKKANNPETWEEFYSIYNKEIIRINKNNNLFVQLILSYRVN